jgi:hypothetical protein
MRELGDVILQAVAKLRELGQIEQAADLELAIYVIPFADLGIKVELPSHPVSCLHQSHLR